METKNLKDLKFKDDNIKNIVRNMLSNGYRIFTYERVDSIEDFVYTNKTTVAYAHSLRGGGLEISTKHIPSKGIGSGFGNVYNGNISHDDPNLFKIMDLGLEFAPPKWVLGKDLKNVKKYTVSSWIESEKGGILNYYEIKD